jgi:hypothetical protein
MIIKCNLKYPAPIISRIKMIKAFSYGPINQK